MAKTIKQIAEILGVSKTAVRNKMTDEVKTKFAQTVCGVIYIDEAGESLIKQAFSKEQPQTKFAPVSANQFAVVSGEVSTLVSTLQKQLEVKDEQIERLTIALENTTASLQAAQALHAGTMKKQIDAPDPDTETNIFKRIFTRSKK